MTPTITLPSGRVLPVHIKAKLIILDELSEAELLAYVDNGDPLGNVVFPLEFTRKVIYRITPTGAEIRVFEPKEQPPDIYDAIATALDNIARGQATTQDEAIAACVQQIKLILSSKEI